MSTSPANSLTIYSLLHSTLATGGYESSLKAYSCFLLHGCCACCGLCPKHFSPDEASSRKKSHLQRTRPLLSGLDVSLHLSAITGCLTLFVALLSEIHLLRVSLRT